MYLYQFQKILAKLVVKKFISELGIPIMYYWRYVKKGMLSIVYMENSDVIVLYSDISALSYRSTWIVFMSSIMEFTLREVM